MTTAKQIIDIAAREIGYSRYDDPQTGSKYGRWYAAYTNSSYYGTNGVPYCAMFVSWVFNQAGAPSLCPGLPGAYCPWIVTAGKNSGQTVPVSQAKQGDVVLFDWGGDGVSDHIGIVESNNGSYLTCIEGNTTGTNGRDGGVNRRTRAYSTVICVIRPKYSGTTSSSTSGSSNSSSSGSSSSSSSSNTSITAGTYTIQVNGLNVRVSPSTSAQSVAQYDKGDKVTLDGWAKSANGWIWGRYIGGASGQYRYIAVKSTDGKTVYAKNISSSAGSTNSSSSSKPATSTTNTSVPSGKYKCVVDKLNVRNNPSTSGTVVASYSKGETVNLDNWSKSADGYIWGRYTSYSGATRYVAVRTTGGSAYLQKV